MGTDRRFVLSWQTVRCLVLLCPRGRLYGLGLDGRVVAGLATVADWQRNGRVVVEDPAEATVFVCGRSALDEPELRSLLAENQNAVAWSLYDVASTRFEGRPVVLPWNVTEPTPAGLSVAAGAAALNDYRQFYRG
mgnify:CR=1 FL=1